MKRVGKWFGIAVAAVGVLVGIVAIWGALLPREHVASGSIHVDAPPEQVYALITELERSPTWREGLERIELLGEVDGNLRWMEHTSFGAVTLERVEARPNTLVVTRVVDTGEGFGGTWTFELSPSDGGTDLTITERGWADNPIFRFLGTYVFGHDQSIEAYQRSVARALST